MIGRRPWSRWNDAGHLSLDAVVAFVDGELTAGPAERAGAHVDHCLTCAGEVAAQRQARRRLRAADTPGVPSSLMSTLRAIPLDAELDAAPPGLAVDEEGRFVVPAAPATGGAGRRGLRSSGGSRPRRRALPAVVAGGLVVGAAAVAAPVVAAGPLPVGTAPVPAAGERGDSGSAFVEHAVGPAAVPPAAAAHRATPAVPPTTTPPTTTPPMSAPRGSSELGGPHA